MAALLVAPMRWAATPGRRWTLIGVAGTITLVILGGVASCQAPERVPSGPDARPMTTLAPTMTRELPTSTPTAPDSDAPTTAPTPAATSAPPSVAPTSWSADLAVLTVAEPASADDYDRALFGGWIDADSNRCTTRCEVLLREFRNDLDGLPNGGWLSAYDGVSTGESSELDIDHVVALGEAWVSGANVWDEQRRRAFANDLTPGALHAVTASVNRSKGDRDLSEWQPPDRASWCEYAGDWLHTKVRWGLSADPLEFTNLVEMLQGCP